MWRARRLDMRDVSLIAPGSGDPPKHRGRRASESATGSDLEQMAGVMIRIECTAYAGDWEVPGAARDDR
jgi:hypothetical protein